MNANLTGQRDYLLEHLVAVPAFRALLRSIEARMIGERAWQRPVLDLGCGDGHFAQAAFTQPLDAGIDPSPQAIAEATRRGMHRELKIADSNAIPYPDGTFATVLSNSVLEHIPDIDATLRETHRVLKPGGLFVFTSPNEHYAEYMFFSDLFNRLGMRGLATRYGNHFNRIAHHFRTDSAQVWTARLERFGFCVRECKTYFSRDAAHVFDLAHYYSAVTIPYRKIFGRWIIAPYRANFVLIEPLLRRYYDEPPADDGASSFFVCERT
ncbi:MAG: class I SAM-dependent methyltransferase [Chloroflexota bacterium]|nr:class I SAM-dependent methyltransferase [Chloroflexota bacterium]